MVDLSLVKPQHLWYVVGLIATDGNLSIDGRHISITSKDKNILDVVKKALFLENQLGKKSRAREKEKSTSYYKLVMCNSINSYKKSV